MGVQRRTWCRIVIAAGLGLPGCGRSIPDEDELIRAANSSNVHRLTNLYASFADRNRGVGPRDERQFREFIPTLGPDRLARMGVAVDDLDALFVSERDGKPFTIKYRSRRPETRGLGQGPAGQAPARPTEVAVVLEAVGVGGVRQVGFLGTRAVRGVGEAEFEQLK